MSNNNPKHAQQVKNNTNNNAQQAAAAASHQTSEKIASEQQAQAQNPAPGVEDQGVVDSSKNEQATSEGTAGAAPEAPGTPAEAEATVSGEAAEVVKGAPAQAPNLPAVNEVKLGTPAKAATATNVGGGTMRTQAKLPSMPVVRESAPAGFDKLTPLSETSIRDDLKAAGEPQELMLLLERLETVEAKLAIKANLSPQEAAKFMESLYKIISNFVELEQPQLTFSSGWYLIMRSLTESKNGGFAHHRIFRGKPFWSLGDEKFSHFEALWSLVDGSVRYRGDVKKFVNMRKVMVGFSGNAQGRLGVFYNSFK